jgi:toxin ParE1/3/4
MRVRWTTAAFDDFTRIVERIRAETPAAAHHVAQTMCKGIALLGPLPNRGRVSQAENTRELVFPPWPYVVVYEIVEGQVQVLRVFHASEDWP